jgi:hypothetical protein
MMELRGWQVAFTGIENFILINTALSVVAFIVAYPLRRARLIRSWHPRARARVYAAALAVPPVVSAWFVCASLFPALWLGEEMWAQEHKDQHSLHLLNAFTVVADPILGYKVDPEVKAKPERRQLTLHADRGSSMKSKPLAMLLPRSGRGQDSFATSRFE